MAAVTSQKEQCEIESSSLSGELIEATTSICQMLAITLDNILNNKSIITEATSLQEIEIMIIV